VRVDCVVDVWKRESGYGLMLEERPIYAGDSMGNIEINDEGQCGIYEYNARYSLGKEQSIPLPG
jgi:hypothetical protein